MRECLSLVDGTTVRRFAERLYALLTDGGEVFMKMDKTPFANRFAMIRDRFRHIMDAPPSARIP
jgi:uncharacterized glyoxalase superfamily protein PhnB